MFSVVRKLLLLRGNGCSLNREDSVDGLRRSARCWEEGQNFGKTLGEATQSADGAWLLMEAPCGRMRSHAITTVRFVANIRAVEPQTAEFIE